MHLLLPFVSAVVYVCAALFLKQTGTRGDVSVATPVLGLGSCWSRRSSRS